MFYNFDVKINFVEIFIDHWSTLRAILWPLLPLSNAYLMKNMTTQRAVSLGTVTIASWWWLERKSNFLLRINQVATTYRTQNLHSRIDFHFPTRIFTIFTNVRWLCIKLLFFKPFVRDKKFFFGFFVWGWRRVWMKKLIVTINEMKKWRKFWKMFKIISK